MPDETPTGDLPGQSGGLNIDANTSIGGNAVGRDSINQTTTTTNTNTTIAEGGPVARYAVIGLIVIAALAIVIIALLAAQGRPAVLIATGTPTASPTAPLVPSQTPSATPTLTTQPPTATPTEPPTAPPTETLVPATPTLPVPTETPLPSLTPTQDTTQPSSLTEPPAAVPTLRATITPTPPATVTDAALPTLTPTPTPWPTSALPLYDNFASSCLNKEKWMLDWVWQGPLPTPGAPVCLETRPQFMGADDGLFVFIDPTVALPKSVTHALTSAQMGYFRQVEVTFALNKVDVFTDTRTAYLSAGVSVQLARPADADLEIRLQGSNAGGKFGYQIVSVLSLKDGSGNIGGGSLPYTPEQPVVVAFRVKGNKLTAYVNDQPIAGPYSILSEPSAVNLGYHAETLTSIDGAFAEVRILQAAVSEIRPGPVKLLSTPTQP